MKDLFSVIPDVLCGSETGYCMGPSTYTPNQKLFYWDWEDKIAKPALESKGYVDVRFWDGERDSFGPLSRIVSAIKDGVREEFVYG